MDALAALAQPKSLQRPLRGLCELLSARRVVWTRPTVMQVQRVPERRIAMLPVRRRNVQSFAAVQLHARRHEMQFRAPALGVRMANPCDVILLMIQPGEGQTLEHVHRLALLILGWCILGCKGQNPVRVGPLAVDAVDQVAGPIHVTTHDLWRRVAAAFLAGQVFRNLTPATAPPAGKLNQHRQAARALLGSPPVRGQSRSAGSEGLSFPRDGGGSQHGQAGSGCCLSAQALAADRALLLGLPDASAGADLRERSAPVRKA